ncbi:RNA pseudouridylate synthase domain-containing protein 2 [Amphibalanus amphitrite]|uniref:RNA pseudouridylate synthase domain-containing protein 2 n=1 Tax=Amphibalanus amphitrite TaxID=1232801 RepID=A0A6A4WTE4_AMPAM|nr:RNA pseudouridylate synthase domain-containing protein 2 [Amphibalanus amphitrite]
MTICTCLRKVYPYYFTFTTFTKGRWVGEKILDVFAREFRAHPAEEYERCIRAGTLTVNYQKVDVDHRLRHNDLLANVVHRHEVPITADPVPLVHMDDDIVVVDKPSSIPVSGRECLCARVRESSQVQRWWSGLGVGSQVSQHVHGPARRAALSPPLTLPQHASSAVWPTPPLSPHIDRRCLCSVLRLYFPAGHLCDYPPQSWMVFHHHYPLVPPYPSISCCSEFLLYLLSLYCVVSCWCFPAFPLSLVIWTSLFRLLSVSLLLSSFCTYLSYFPSASVHSSYVSILGIFLFGHSVLFYFLSC